MQVNSQPNSLTHPIRVLALVLGISLASAGNADSTGYYRYAGIATSEEVAGGFRALFTCSAHFVAGRTLAQILDIELRDTTALSLPDPVIDIKRQMVTAEGPGGHTHIAVYRESMGCVLLPPDWTRADVPRLAYTGIRGAPDVADIDFPLGDKVRTSPSRKQRAVLNTAFDGTTFGEGTLSAGVIVVKGSTLVAEQYGNGFDVHKGYRTWSTAKSISSSLIGIATGDGLLALDDPVPIPEWQYLGDSRQAITLRHLLNMSSGLESGGSNTNAVYFGGQDAISAITGSRLEVEPNTRWQYANNDTLLALRALRHVLNDDHRYMQYPYVEFFHRIGMYHTRMETDHAGNFIGSSQVYTTTRDLARLGILYLRDGVWNGERILPAGWTDFVATAAPTRPRAENERGYGGQFWLLDTFDGIPRGTYTTAGNKGQYMTIVPERNMVVVRTGVDPLGTRWEHEAFIRSVLAVF